MKFRNLNKKAIDLLHSKRNLKIKERRIYLLIKEHNDLCLMLKCFNEFWKRLFVFLFSFYVILIWMIVYVTVVYADLDLFPKLFMYMAMSGCICTFACISFNIFNISSEVI